MLLVDPTLQRAQTTCFIAASFRTNLRTVKRLLKQRGIKILVPSERGPTSTSLTESVTKAISEADLVIAILDPQQTNANVFFELGCASAFGKRILVLAPPALKIIPSDIVDVQLLRTDPDNSEAIGFALDQLAIVMPLTKHRRAWPRLPIRKSRPIPDSVDALARRLEELGDLPRERDVEDIVVSALRASGVSVVARSGTSDTRVDLAVWADEFDPLIGNPLLIEIKRKLHRELIPALLDQLSTYLQQGNSQWALVLYLRGPTQIPKMPSTLSSRVLFLEVRELLDRLRKSGFGSIVRDLRNRRVHGVDN
jgi:hypothetical protein